MLVLNSLKWLINRYFTLTNKNAAFKSRDQILIIVVFTKLRVQIFLQILLFFIMKTKRVI